MGDSYVLTSLALGFPVRPYPETCFGRKEDKVVGYVGGKVGFYQCVTTSSLMMLVMTNICCDRIAGTLSSNIVKMMHIFPPGASIPHRRQRH